MVLSLVNPALLFAEGDNEKTTVHREEERFEEFIVSIDHQEKEEEIRPEGIKNLRDLHESLLNKQGLTIKDDSLNTLD